MLRDLGPVLNTGYLRPNPAKPIGIMSVNLDPLIPLL